MSPTASWPGRGRCAGPIAESRSSRRDDGRYAYETKKGVTLVMPAEQSVRRGLSTA